jgi:hypothetical protein
MEELEATGAHPEKRKEHVMMFAFVLALVGVVVLASFEHLGARS